MTLASQGEQHQDWLKPLEKRGCEPGAAGAISVAERMEPA